MSDKNDFTQVPTASVWAIKHCVCCVNPANPDDRMEFDDLVQLNAKLFELKEQVGRLTALVESNLNQSKVAMANSDASVRILEAQVERLTKAGDAMASILQFEEQLYHEYAQDPKPVQDWNDAKEGKPQS